MKSLGRFMKDINTEIIEIDGRCIVIDFRKYDGDKYFDCFELADNLIDIINTDLEVKPIYKEVAEDEFEIIDYEIL